MTVLSLIELQDVFYSLTLLAPSVESQNIRHWYQTDSAPAFEKTEDVIFINIRQRDDAYDKARHIQYNELDPENAEESIFYTRVLEVQWICYGPHSFNHADDIRNKILTRDGRSILRASRIFPLTDIPAPVRLPYMHNNQWWERSDVTAYFNLETLRNNEVPYLQGAEVTLLTEKVSENVTIIATP